MQHQADSLIADNGTYVTRQDIVNFPFSIKLWLVIHLDFCDFLQWNRDGTVILLDLVALEEYLNSSRSIFKIKNRSTFLEHLEQFKFERLNATPEAEEDLLLQYKSEYFQRHRLDLLAKIRLHTYQSLDEPCESIKSTTTTTNRIDGNNKMTDKLTTSEQHMSTNTKANCRPGDRMMGDLCFMSHGSLSNIQKSRLHFQTILNFQNETRILQDKLQASDDQAAAHAQQRRHKAVDLLARCVGAIAAAPCDEEQVIELPVEMFENPHDSVLHLGEDFRPEYAGYYGNCSKEQIMHFFGDYLPMYEDGSMEVKKIIADTCSNNQSQPMTSELEPLETIHPHDEFQISTTSMETLSQPSMPTLNLSSALEPIFKTDEEEVDSDIVGNINNIGADAETDISMEDFLKFKANDNAADMLENNSDSALRIITPTTDFPQMPSAVKMEITDEDDCQNEANFRNFFSQYRASLNLLYERH